MRRTPTAAARIELDRPGVVVHSLAFAALTVALVTFGLWLAAHPTVAVALAGTLAGALAVRARLLGRLRRRLGRLTRRWRAPAPAPSRG